jgi:DNA invertase Pin-like site-specific DNA recombinase
MTVWGYLRVSTKKQEIENNRNEIKNLAYEKQLGLIKDDNWIQEKISGRKDWRKRELGKAFEKMDKNDILIMSEYSRIGRDFLQSMEFIAECRRKNVIVYSTLGDIPIKDDATSNLLLALKAWKSQVELEDLKYRTKIGIKAHQDTGSIFGRKKDSMILDKDLSNIDKIKGMINNDVKYKKIAETFKCTTVTLRKYIKKHNLKPIKIKIN